MDTYKAQGAEVTIDGDVLVLTRKRIGKDDVRRIPLAAVTDVRLKPGSTFTADLLQLVLNDEPAAEMTLLEPNTLAFPNTPKHKKSLAALQARLQAAVEHNRATGGGPVAYDGPRRTLGRRLEESIERDNRRRAEREAQQAEADRQQAEADERARLEGIRAELAAAGITREDVIAAADATMAFGAFAAEIIPIAHMLRPDEPLVRATRAAWDDRLGMLAITDSRLILMDKALFSDQVTEFPLSSVVTVGLEQDLLANGLTLHLHAGQTVRLRNVDDIEPFADALRNAVRQAGTPTAPQPDILDHIAKLADLHAAGVLTDEEFQAKKTELLNRL